MEPNSPTPKLETRTTVYKFIIIDPVTNDKVSLAPFIHTYSYIHTHAFSDYRRQRINENGSSLKANSVLPLLAVE